MIITINNSDIRKFSFRMYGHILKPWPKAIFSAIEPVEAAALRAYKIQWFRKEENSRIVEGFRSIDSDGKILLEWIMQDYEVIAVA